MGLAWGFGYWVTNYFFDTCSREKVNIINLFFGLFASSWLGAKVFFLFFSSQNALEKYLYANEFWLGGGFVFYGGLIFGLIFYLIYALYLKKFPIQESHLLLPGLVFGHAIGRIGCFFTGCCFGSQCTLPWAVSMHGALVHPVQLYEALGLTLIGIFSIKHIRKKLNWQIVLSRYLLLYSVLRFSLEFFRGDAVRGIYFFGFSTSQWVSIALMVFAIVLFYNHKKESLKGI